MNKNLLVKKFINYYKKLQFFYILVAILIVFVNSAIAGPISNPNIIVNPAKEAAQQAKYEVGKKGSLGFTASIIVRGFLIILGTIFIGYLIYGGYVLMMAKGNQEEVTKAKDTITHALIGLIIVLSAYAITYFIFEILVGDWRGAWSNDFGG